MRSWGTVPGPMLVQAAAESASATAASLRGKVDLSARFEIRLCISVVIRHSREGGNPGGRGASAVALDPRFRGGGGYEIEIMNTIFIGKLRSLAARIR